MGDLEVPECGATKMTDIDYGCHWCGADSGEPCYDDCPVFLPAGE